MSDTSGGGGLGSAGRKIRINMKVRFGGSNAHKKSTANVALTTASSSKKVRGAESVLGAMELPGLFWRPLDEKGILDDVLLPSELQYYFEQMAKFCDTAKRSGLTAVAQTFAVQPSATFLSVRRAINFGAPGNCKSESRRQVSEHHDRAGGAFNSASARWAQQVTKIDDPTQIPIARVVERVRAIDRYGLSLKLSARLILQEYGERVIRAAIREDDAFRRVADRHLVDEFGEQLDRFFERHSAHSEWSEAHIIETLKQLPAFLKQ